ncbi:MAG: 4Fe-4S binding protein [Anaerolineae bacterium]
MPRQRIRRTVLLVSFLFFPVTLYLFSPVLILAGASEGVVAGSALTFGLLFLSALFVGRAWCGWLCPAGALQDWCAVIQPKGFGGGKGNWAKYGIWVPWMVLIGVVVASSGLPHALAPFYQMEDGVTLTTRDGIQSYVVYYAVVALIVTLALTAGKRAFCHAVCWMAPFVILGTRLRDALRLPGLHLCAERSACANCRACTKACPMSLDVHAMVQRGRMTNDECILCGTCADTCPNHVIRYAYRRKRTAQGA